MRILFLAPTYLGLYKPIYNEMKTNGNDVFYLEDKLLPYDNFGKEHKPLYSKIIYRLKFMKGADFYYEKYWQILFKEKKMLNNIFDILFVINGTSFHPVLIDNLKKQNPTLKTSLYIWDTCKYYDFARNIPFFDNVFSFDREDAKLYGLKYLPIYCPYFKYNPDNTNYYDAFCIGAYHDGRFDILKSIASQLDSLGLTYLFKVVLFRQEPSWKFKIKKLFHIISQDDIKQYEFAIGMRSDEILINESVPVREYIKLLLQSQVVIDTDRESQTGLTPRLVWAIMAGKRVITTNAKLLDDPYCIGCDIIVIDRNKPVIRKEMFSYVKRTPSAKLRSLYLKEWVENFIS